MHVCGSTQDRKADRGQDRRGEERRGEGTDFTNAISNLAVAAAAATEFSTTADTTYTDMFVCSIRQSKCGESTNSPTHQPTNQPTNQPSYQPTNYLPTYLPTSAVLHDQKILVVPRVMVAAGWMDDDVRAAQRSAAPRSARTYTHANRAT